MRSDNPLQRLDTRIAEWTTFCRKAKGVTDDWDSYACHVDGKAASIYLNLGLARAVPINDLDHLAYVRLFMHRPRPDGLSSQEEYEALISVEDALVPNLERSGAVRCGTSDGRRRVGTGISTFTPASPLNGTKR